MYNYKLHQYIHASLLENGLDLVNKDNLFYTRLVAGASEIEKLYNQLYGNHFEHQKFFDQLLQTIVMVYINRDPALKQKDLEKEKLGNWFLSNQITGMSLYVDRFCGNIKKLVTKLDYFKKLGVNFLHLMPMFESPEGESDGGYAVSDFRKVDERFGTLKDLQGLQKKMGEKQMYLMLDIVLNHTSHHHEWAEKAKKGDKKYQDYFYMYDNRELPDKFDETMPEVFPESSPGSFTYVKECDKWVMTVFHSYQWDLNYSNPEVFIEMLNTIFFYANLGVDILRIDAPAFIWKQLGTTCQNLPEAHTILKLIKQCVRVATPGMALLGEAIVAPNEIIKYFGTGSYLAMECDVAYNATQMAVQWDALATGETKVMMAAQQVIQKKPFGTTWINYTRCHDDIGLGYEDYMIAQAGFNPYEHRKFLKNYYSGNFDGSPSKGELFSVNPKTQDARISGSLASLCGLEKALDENNDYDIEISIHKILLMQAQSFFIGGIPTLFYGDELGYTNDYSYLNDKGKSYDNRWMHRPLIDWNKNKRVGEKGTIEERIFSNTQKLISIRKKLPVLADLKNITWLIPNSKHLAVFIRENKEQKLICIFNYSHVNINMPWEILSSGSFYDHWREEIINVSDNLKIEPYSFYLLEIKD